MSQYLCVYVRVNDKFAPIGTYSRSNVIYRAFSNEIPYEKIRAVRPTDLERVMRHLHEKLNDYVKDLGDTANDIEMIMNAANTPLTEKLDAIAGYQQATKEIEDEIEEVKYAMGIISTYQDMIDAYHYSEAEEQFENDYFHYLYAGIEAYGSMENVVED